MTTLTLKQRLKRGTIIGAIVGAIIGIYIGFTTPLEDESHYQEETITQNNFEAIMNSPEFSDTVVESIPEPEGFMVTTESLYAEYCVGDDKLNVVDVTFDDDGSTIYVLVGDRHVVDQAAATYKPDAPVQLYYCN